MSFTENNKSHFKKLTEALFSELKGNEELNISLSAEDSEFVRFNGSKVRQNTAVEQRNLTLTLQSEQRKISIDTTLQSDFESDIKLCKSLLLRARDEVKSLPVDPFVVAMANNGQSDNDYKGEAIAFPKALDNIISQTGSADFAGFFSNGPVIRATKNSKGQDHWFSTETFFVDYSLYTTNIDGENKAVKSVYSDNKWNEATFSNKIQSSLNQLSLMKKKSQVLKPGGYRVYMAPGATSELLGMFSWNAMSFSAMKRGQSAMAKLYEKEKTLSPLFSLRENFGLGLSPQFNSLGEVSPRELSLIENGVLKNMLVSSRAQKEYGVPANGSDISGWGHEYLRSPEVLGGNLAERDALKALGTGLFLSNLHYLNWSDVAQARITGMTRYACFWVEQGEIVGPIKDLRFDETLYNCLGAKLEAVTQEQHIDPVIETYGSRQIGGKKIPGLLINDFQFTL